MDPLIGKPRSRKRDGAATRRSSCSRAAAARTLPAQRRIVLEANRPPPCKSRASKASGGRSKPGIAPSDARCPRKPDGRTSFNVAVKIAGSNPALAPLVVMAPRSGWWQCASEQGSRLACWLEAIRILAAGRPARDTFFVALSGHELGFLGIDAYLKRRGDFVKRAHMWIFFGSDIGAPDSQSHPRIRR